jgi:beta-glucosidase
MTKLTRRRFAQTAAATAATAFASASLPKFALAQVGTPAELKFPAGFLWGTATASYQVEGAVKEDGRKPSIWDTFSHTPGKTHDGDTGDVADDFYHRYKEDIQTMKGLGCKVFRLSIAWSRVFPDGTGQPNPKGLDFYNHRTDGNRATRRRRSLSTPDMSRSISPIAFIISLPRTNWSASPTSATRSDNSRQG